VTHLDHRSEQVRLEQWAAAHTWLLRDRARPHLLVGDFNALAASDYRAEGALDRLAAYQQERGWPTPAFDLHASVVKAGYVDAYEQAGRGPGATLPAAEPERRIDYIFLSQPCAPALVACEPLDTSATRAASDHLPVFAELSM
jgi:endonuclease/exonuclease/phosphatase family metal-dependent hydrolase